MTFHSGTVLNLINELRKNIECFLYFCVVVLHSQVLLYLNEGSHINWIRPIDMS